MHLIPELTGHRRPYAELSGHSVYFTELSEKLLYHLKLPGYPTQYFIELFSSAPYILSWNFLDPPESKVEALFLLGFLALLWQDSGALCVKAETGGQ